ncbi:MAG: hypothetical protein IJ960_06710 [Oscillospiraceae bacterium]|nr:hypothetical protein [Oscillospiraceae bacterium]
MQELEIVRGTTCPLHIALSGEDGADYVLAEGAVLLFGIRHVLGTETVLVKKSTASDEGGYVFDIRPEDTVDLTPGDYKYTVNMQTGNDFYPVIKLADLKIIDAITKKGDGE